MNHPHLTPSHLFPDDSLPGDWSIAKIAYVCFTPFPEGFNPYVMDISKTRYFLHSPPGEVRFCKYGSDPFLVISEVYGFAVGTTTIEELIHYGVETIIGIGYVGAFNDAPTGEKFIAESAKSDLPIAVHYGIDAAEPVFPSRNLNIYLLERIAASGERWGCYNVWNSNSLYREYDLTLDKMRALGCQVVNMDTLSVFAASQLCSEETGRHIEYAYLGTVTDSSGGDDGWDSDLMDAIGGEKGQSHDQLVKLLVEDYIPNWSAR